MNASADFKTLEALQSQMRSANRAWDAERIAAGIDMPSYDKKLERGELLVGSRDMVRDGLKAYRCSNPDCLAMFVSREPEVDCRACATQGLIYKVVSGTLNGTPCNAVCTNAVGGDCRCSCGGENHGAKYLVGWTFPRNIEARRAEREAKRALEATYGAQLRDLAEAAAPIREYFEALEANAIEARDEMLDAVAEQAQTNRPPVLRTKAGKPSADQLFDLYVTKARIMERDAFGSGDTETFLAITGFDGDGNKFWAKVADAGCYKWENVGRWSGERVASPLIHKGDLVRIKGRLKEDKGEIKFLSHAHLVASADLMDLFA